MTATRRALVALVLLLTIPLRAMAAVAMPCCPLPDPATPTQAMAGMDDHAAMHDDEAPAGPLDAGDDHRHQQPVACCAIAMIASSAGLPALPHAAPVTVDARFAAVAPFLTDAPERPPRLPDRSA